MNKKKYNFFYFFLSRHYCIINRFVENASKQKAVDTAKVKKINNNRYTWCFL